MTTSAFLPQFVEPDSKDFINLFDSPLFAYLRTLKDDNRYLDNQGLAMDDQEYTGTSNKISLDKMYIFPAASKERIDPDEMVKLSKTKEEELLLALPDVIENNPRVTLLGDPGIGKSTFIQWLTLSLTVAETSTKAWFRDLLPIVLTARKLVRPKDAPEVEQTNALTPHSNPSYSCQAFIHAITNSLGQAGQTLKNAHEEFVQRLETGQAILLVDGVDEISADTSLWLAESLKVFLRRYPKVRLILTARVVGFDNEEFWWPKAKEALKLKQEVYFEPEILRQTAGRVNRDTFALVGKADDTKFSLIPYPHFYLAPFDTQRRNDYVKNWTQLYLPKKTEIDAFSQTLRTTCRDTHYLDALSRNPVLLTMICFIQWRVGQLPNGRAELYQRIVATYLVALDRARKTKIAYTPDNNAYDFDDIKLWLGKLAWQMQCGKLISLDFDSADDDPQYQFKPFDIDIFFGKGRDTIIYQSDLCLFFATQLTHVICSQNDIDIAQGALPSKAHLEANKLIDFLKKRTGFLIPKGLGQKSEGSPVEDFFSFSHLSFQEYFAGYYLSENWGEWSKEKDICAQLENSLHDDAWVEVWQLAFEESSRKQQSTMLTTLFDENQDFIKLESFSDILGMERASLFAKVVMNPTIKLKLVDRERYIRTLWEAVLDKSAPSFGGSKRDLMNALWKEAFGSTDILIALMPTTLNLENSYSEQKATALSQLTALEELNVSFSHVTTLPNLSKLTKLKKFNAKSASLNDVTALCHLPQLTHLWLFDNPINDITPLLTLSQLEELSLASTQVTSLLGIEQLSNIQKLDIEACEITDLSPLAALPKLANLNVDQIEMASFEVLSKLHHLESLSAAHSQINQLPDLSGLNKLNYVRLEFNELSNIDEISKLTKLEVLMLDGNHISDLSPLAQLTALDELNIARNPVESFAPLAQCPRLRKLIIDEEQEEQLDLSMLEEHIELDVISMDDEPW